MAILDARPGGAPRLETPSEFRLGYRRWLDGLRGWAILLVLAFHFGLVRCGSLGVDVFFVLSGFLITCLLAEEWRKTGAVSLKKFYLRRALRLWPAFAVLVACFVVPNLIWRPHLAAACWREALVAGCYVANWPHLHGVPMGALGHTWSLSLEEQFYLVWPLVLSFLFARGLSPRRLAAVTAAGVVACMLYRAGMFRYFGKLPGADRGALGVRIYMGLDTRADSLLVGCTIGVLAAWNLLPRSAAFVRRSGYAALGSSVGLGYLVLFSRGGMPIYWMGLLTLVALMTGAIIVRMLVAPSRLGTLLLEPAPLVWAGRLSYGLYLYHMLVMYWLAPGELGWRRPGQTALVAALSLAAAVASYFLVERPCLRLKDRFGRAAPPNTAADSTPARAAA